MKTHNLLQAILAVNDLFYLVEPAAPSHAHNPAKTGEFREIVLRWLQLNTVPYRQMVTFAGRSTLEHQFDFVIPPSERQPNRFVRTINHPDRRAVEAMVFSWADTKDNRPADSRAYALLNDSGQAMQSSIPDALFKHDVNPVPWSGIEAVKDELTT